MSDIHDHDETTYVITETIEWHVPAKSPQEALRAFMDTDPMTQYGAYMWEITDRTVEGPDPKTGEEEVWNTEELEEQIAEEG